MIKPKLLLVLPLLFAGFCLDVGAQQPAEAPADQAVAARRPGKVRAWLFPGAPGAESIVLSATAPDGNSIAFATAAAPTTDSAYRDLPAGTYSFDLKDKETVIGQKKERISSGSFYTLVAWPKDGKWTMELYSDDAASGGGPRPLRLLNFAGQATTTVKVGGLPTAVTLVPDSLQEIKLPAKITPFEVIAQPPGAEPPARTINDVDMTLASAVYILVSPDYRGRLRPQIIEGGEPVGGGE